VIPLIQEIVGPNVKVIDPAPAVARQVGRVLNAHGLKKTNTLPGKAQYLTSGDPWHLSTMLPPLIGEQASVKTIYWQDGFLLG
jgi:glutamate racemase